MNVFFQHSNPFSNSLFILHYFLLSMSATTSLCCNSQGIAFNHLNTFRYFTNRHKINLHFISTYIACCFPLLLLFKRYICHTQLLFMQNLSNLLSSTFLLPNPYPPCAPSKPSINLPTGLLKSRRPRIRIISLGFCKSHTHDI